MTTNGISVFSGSLLSSAAIELIDFERAADAVAGEILQHRERHDVVGAGLPRFDGRERPRQLVGADDDLAFERLAARRYDA